jgi:hypothetical protein
MGWGFRRSINFGPLRINLAKSGVGYSVGTRGLRVGKDARKPPINTITSRRQNAIIIIVPRALKKLPPDLK